MLTAEMRTNKQAMLSGYSVMNQVELLSRPAFAGFYRYLANHSSSGSHMASWLTSSTPLLTCICLFVTCSVLPAAEVVDTSQSAYAKLKPVDLEVVKWTDGFWADRLEVCYESSIPTMWQLMESGKYKPFLGHFLIAAGEEEGGHHGAKWNDGDFYKWMEAAIASVAVTGDEQIAAAIERSIEAIGKAQREDGYIHTPVLIANRNGDVNVKPFQDRHAFEMYNMGHLLTTASLHHRVTGKTNFLEIAEKAAEFLIDTFKHPTPQQARHAICPSHYMGAIELYRTTGNERYLDLAKTFLDMRNLVTDGGDDNQDRIPFVQQREAVGHAVRANYLYAGAADLYAETGAGELLAPLLIIWENMVEKKLYITGGCGALYDGASPAGSADQAHITRVHQAYGMNYQLPNTTAHNETCANIGNLLWNWRMFVLTGEGKYIDVLERSLYNSILSGVSLSGTEYFYVNPLRVVDPLPTSLRFPRDRQKFFTSFCCPPNLLRTIAQVGGYAYSQTDDAIWVNLYGANHLKSSLLGEPVEIAQKTDYPWGGQVRFEINVCPEESFALKLRIPDWAEDASLTINGEKQSDLNTELGYCSVKRNWKAGDVVELEFPMESKLMQAHPLVEEAANQVAVQRGPIVYCVESVDLPAGVQIEDVVIPLDIEFEANYRPDFLQGIVTLEGTAIARELPEWEDQLYREAKPAPREEFQLQLIPYYTWANRGETEMTVWMPVE